MLVWKCGGSGDRTSSVLTPSPDNCAGRQTQELPSVFNSILKRESHSMSVPKFKLRKSSDPQRYSELGFPEGHYQYLASKFFQVLKRLVLARDRHRCTFCGDKAENLLHTSTNTETLLGSNSANLYSVCPKCLKSLSFTKSGQKLPRQKIATRIFRKFVKLSPEHNVGKATKRRNKELEEKTKLIGELCREMLTTKGKIRAEYKEPADA